MPPSSLVVLGVLFLVQCAFASLSIVGKVLLHVVPWPALMLARAAGGAAIFALLGVARREPLLPPRGERARVVLLGFLGVFVNQGSFLAGLRRTTAINATVLVATIPIFTAVFAVASGREPPRARLAAGLGLAAAGAALVVRPERFAVGPGQLAGDALIVVNSVAYGLYLLLARDAIVRHGASRVIRWVFAAGAVLALPVGAASLVASAPGWSGRTLGVLGYVLLVPTAFAYLANGWCLGRAPASVVSLFVYFQPVLAAALALTVGPVLARWLGVAVAAEALGLRTVAGAAAILAGVAVATYGRGARPTSRVLPRPGEP